MKALIIDNVSAKIPEMLRSKGVDVDIQVMPGAERLKTLITDVDLLVMRVLPAIDKEILDCGKQLKAIAVCSVGTTHIDLDYAKEKGIAIINAPAGSTNAVAELAICKLLELNRRTVLAHNEVTGQRVWEKNHFKGHELMGQTLGLVGYGRIGRRTAELARAFGMRTIVYDPYMTAEQCAATGGEKMDKDEFLATADCITIHLPLTPETDNLISFDDIAKMKDGAIVINMSRGGVLNEEAAAQALKSGKLSGVGADVVKGELADLTGGDVLESPLFEVGGNFVVTPHIGAATAEAQARIGDTICEQVQEFFHL